MDIGTVNSCRSILGGIVGLDSMSQQFSDGGALFYEWDEGDDAGDPRPEIQNYDNTK